MKNRIHIVALMGVAHAMLEQVVEACEEGGDHKLGDEMAQFRDEFKVRLDKEAEDFDVKLKDINEAMKLSMGLEATRRAGGDIDDKDYGELHDTLQRGLDAYRSLE